jgi:hypothetical protein
MPTGQVLTSWKEIASFMGKGVRTVQRWEAEMELPVRRPAADRHIVLAFPQELEAWARRKLESPKIASENSKLRHRHHPGSQLLRMRYLVQIMKGRLEQNRACAEQLRRQCERSRFAVIGSKRNGNRQISDHNLSQSA